MQETRVQFLGQEDSLEKEMATHSSILAWRIPWTEEPSWTPARGLQESDTTYQMVKNLPAMGQTWVDPWVGKIPWRRAWQPTPVFLRGESPWTEEPGGL